MISITRNFIVLLLLLTSCFMTDGSSSSQKGPYHYTHNGKQLNQLYNVPIRSIQEYSRPLNVPGGKFLNYFGINHRGQVATLRDGRQFLVHKGNDFGIYSNTVAVDRKYMSNKWSSRGPVIDQTYGKGNVRLGDLIKSGGAGYNAFCNNCIHGSNRMQERFRNGK